MAKKVFTDGSLETFVNEIKSYADNSAASAASSASTKANSAYSLAEQKAQVQIITWGADD